MLLGSKLNPFANGVKNKQFLKAALVQLSMEASKPSFMNNEKTRFLAESNDRFAALKEQHLQTARAGIASTRAQVYSNKAAALGVQLLPDGKLRAPKEVLEQFKAEMEKWDNTTWGLVQAAFDAWVAQEADKSVNTEAAYKNFWRYFCNTSATLGPKSLAKNGEGQTYATLIKHAGSKLSELQVLHASPVKEFAGAKPGMALLAFISELLESDEFKPNRAAMVEVQPPGLNTQGHAIAMFMTNTSKFLFFDPNIGVYDFDTVGAKKAFVFLFGKAYPDKSEPSGLRDAKDYEVNNKVSGCYVIFKGPGADNVILRVLQTSNS